MVETLHRLGTLEKLFWVAAFGLVIALAVPWFLWRSAEVAFGLPVWLWWHIGWMVVAAGVFWVFANRAWGLGIEEGF
jgi:hypothetical protein